MSEVNSARTLQSRENTKLTFIFTDKDAGAIIGKGGCNIKDIKEKTNCALAFHGHLGMERFLTISGSVGMLAKAVYMIANTLLQHPSQAVDLDDRRENAASIILLLLLPVRLCGAIIGKRGESVKNIMSTTNTKIRIYLDHSGYSKDRTTKLEGTPEAIQKAIECIARISAQAGEEVKDLDSIPGRSDFDHSYSSRSTPSVLAGIAFKSTQTLYLDKAIARIIVGRLGSTIQEIRQISKAYVQVDDIPGNPSQSAVLISGNPSCVAVALHLIEAKVGSQVFPNQKGGADTRPSQNGSYDARYKENAPTPRRTNLRRNDRTPRDNPTASIRQPPRRD